MANGARSRRDGVKSKPVQRSANSRENRESHRDTRPSSVGAQHGRRSGALLRETAGKRESRMTAFEKMNLVDKGISKNDLESLKQTAGLDYEKLARVLSTTRATLINKKGVERFNTSLSERIISLADIYSYGYEVFEDQDRFNAWIFRPNQALGGNAPYDLLDNQFGREEVKNVIGRIAYGVYS